MQVPTTDSLMDVEFLDLERGINGSYDGWRNGLEAWTHQVSPGKNTLLHVVANFGELDLAKRLLSSIPNPSDVSSALLRQNTRGDTPLYCAARRGKADFVDLFISNSKVSNIEDNTRLLTMKNKQGDTALHLAARNNHFDVVDKLMEEDTDLGSTANNSGECPLYVAAYKGFLDITERLLQSTATGPGKRTALHAAVAQRHQDVVDLLLAKRPELCRERDGTGSTSLLCVASFRNIKMVQASIKIVQASIKIVQALLDADISTVLLLDENGLSALHVAAAVGRINVLQEILGRRHDFWELIDNTGKTFLHVAIENRREAVVKYVLKDVQLKELLNQPDDEGNTPLHLAVISSDVNIFRLLLADNRVVLDNVNQKGQTPLDLAYSVIWDDSPIKFQMKLIVFDLESCMRYSPQRWDLELKRRRNIIEERKEIKWRRAIANHMAIVAVLIATVTFAAAFSLPGGYKNDGGIEQGMASLTKATAFKVFLIFDTLAMITSIIAIWFLFGIESIFRDVSLRSIHVSAFLLNCSVVEMIVAFLAGVYAVVSAECLWLAVVICSLACILPFSIYTRRSWAYGINPCRRTRPSVVKKRNDIDHGRTS